MSEIRVVKGVEKNNEETTPRRHPRKIVIPRRVPSIKIPERQPVYITPDKTTCELCSCFPKEDPYIKNKKLNKCQKSPLTLYELSAKVVDSIPLPIAFGWTENDVAEWMGEEVGLPEYKECILKNNINGLRCLMLEDPAIMPPLNITNFSHIKLITSKVRELFGTEFVLFARSIGLPPRKPLTHCVWFKSRTGPSWGIRTNWTRCDILRWMKILMPEPVRLDHWDLVWYMKPDFPCVRFARIPKPPSQVYIPQYKPRVDVCNEYLVPRKFRIQTGISESRQVIWMEHIPERTREEKPEKKMLKIIHKQHESRLLPKKISLTGLSGKEFVLAKRRMPKRKFLS